MAKRGDSPPASGANRTHMFNALLISSGNSASACNAIGVYTGKTSLSKIFCTTASWCSFNCPGARRWIPACDSPGSNCSSRQRY